MLEAEFIVRIGDEEIHRGKIPLNIIMGVVTREGFESGKKEVKNVPDTTGTKE